MSHNSISISLLFNQKEILMILKDIFENFGLKHTYNIALLPQFVKGLLEIHRIESFRRNNRDSDGIKVTALGNHGLWQAKRIVLVGFEGRNFTPEPLKLTTITEINSAYDHIISLDEDFKLLSNSEEVESYLHTYVDIQRTEKKSKKVIAPKGCKVIVTPRDREFTEEFIREYLNDYELYLYIK
ncbi:hypothetical protein [Litorilituus lipolyticus]|uniref:Uncharacterized protein n=1 Tax=Litorilituus lipolyticus TaxID=2491017 RepID=A0A502KZ75_9GAMM|nr:hypothetical protein [Litorilituus lipolyticus]TPH15859.1 hypothetical protein EPA86_07780 [Litorilituus lipolyticus]